MEERTDQGYEEFKDREDRISVIKELLSNPSSAEFVRTLEEIEPEDIADILGEFSIDDKILIFNSLSEENAAVVLDDTDPQTRLQILQKSDNEKLAGIIDIMPVDEAADVIEEVAEEKREDLLDLMEKEDAEEVEEILSYPEDSAGRVMNPDFVSVEEEDAIEDAIEHIRSIDFEQDFFSVYVVDKKLCLKGIVSIRKLLLAPKGTYIKDILDEGVHSVYVDTDQEQAAGVMRKYDLASLPVVDHSEKLVGRITVDDIIDVIDEEQAEDISMMTGTIEEEYGTESTLQATQNRLPWLFACMLGSILTGLVIQMFELTIAEVIALVSFIPVITATGGNSGVQASTVVVRGIALGHMDLGKLKGEVLRQFKIALTLGIVCGVSLTFIANFWKNNSMVGIIVGVSLFLVVVWSNFVGVVVPMMFKKLNIDPALASGPLTTTLNDIVGVFIYLSVAALIL
jgi:magnesium transporter